MIPGVVDGNSSFDTDKYIYIDKFDRQGYFTDLSILSSRMNIFIKFLYSIL